MLRYSSQRLATSLARSQATSSRLIRKSSLPTSSHRLPNSHSSRLILGSTLAALALSYSIYQLRPELIPTLPTLLAESSSSYVDPTTSTPFPKTLVSPSTGTKLRLVGTGVRVVSFLNIRVYTAAFYVEESVLSKLRLLPGWSNYSSDALMPPFDDTKSGESLMTELLKTSDCAVVITPLRNTTLAHLRDGFCRALVARMKLPSVTSSWSETDGSTAADALSELKSFFPARTLTKGTQLRLWYASDANEVGFEIEDVKSKKKEHLGSLDNRLLAIQLILSYFSDHAEISTELRQSVAKGFEGEPR